MKKIFSSKLKEGNHIRIIAPSRSLALISPEVRTIALGRFAEMGFEVSFSKHCEEKDNFNSSSISSRIKDLHEAFRDPSINAIFAVIGGYNSNQLLGSIDYELIRTNPKILCGYSDITALSNAIFAKTGLVGYSGPHFSTFGMKKYFDYIAEYFEKCVMHDGPFKIKPSKEWSEDRWYQDQENRVLKENPGWLAVQFGSAEGTIIGGNLCTFNLLNGTQYMPPLDGAILFLEDDDMYQEGEFPADFDRNLQSLIHQTGFEKVRGIVLGRFQSSSNMTDDMIRKIIETKAELQGMPILANVDFGHTNPLITFPIGGTVKVVVSDSGNRIEILEH